jgi:DNA-binding transcriptional MerR regulator
VRVYDHFEVIKMLVSETSKMTGLTKKAIEYYAEQQLVFPVTLENGYKDYHESDLDRLRKIYVLRKLGLSIAEIKSVFTDATGKALNQISKQKMQALQEEQMKKNMLDELVMGKSYDEIAVRLESMSKYETVKQKLLDAFPGFYGRFICLHFARFLKEPILTERTGFGLPGDAVIS